MADHHYYIEYDDPTEGWDEAASREDAIETWKEYPETIVAVHHWVGEECKMTFHSVGLLEFEDFYDQQTKKQIWPGSFAKDMNKQIDEENKPVDANPKTLAALNKARCSDVPPVAFFALGAAMSDGAKKYGRYNWRDTGVTASVFYDALMRHLQDWYNGESYAEDSKIHHLAHLMAGAAILLDAEKSGVLKDDRAKEGNISRQVTAWSTNA